MKAHGSPTAVDLGRHEHGGCKICSHPQREEIERDFVNWRSPAQIATEYRLGNRRGVYRHAHALGLFPKRQRNVRPTLEKLIERAGDAEGNAAAVRRSRVQAIVRLAPSNHVPLRAPWWRLERRAHSGSLQSSKKPLASFSFRLEGRFLLKQSLRVIGTDAVVIDPTNHGLGQVAGTALSRQKQMFPTGGNR